MTYQFEQVDVFTTQRFAGNPLAVFTDAAGLTREQMQLIAREMNLSETTFVVPTTRADCVARYHIFTPGQEMPFAGHPTLGTAYVLARGGRVPNAARSFQLEAKVGPVAVRIEEKRAGTPSMLFFTSPEVVFGPTYDDRARIAEALNLGESDLLPKAPVEQAGCPVLYLYVGVKTAQHVDQVMLNSLVYSRLLGNAAPDAVYVFAPSGTANRFYARMLCLEKTGLVEDPATGSAASPLGAYLVRHRLISGEDEVEIVIEQGVKMGRRSLLTVRVARSGQAVRRIEVGGSVVPVLKGQLSLEEAGH
ncbi:MAG TPA: PhzF family phenazine biosynthesis protein [Candidatus Eremiobacteraceae bacterium]|nr:PhzF family phenazine biosynthesis protein [Candidatus Eremiobacteraceae bacterium]